MPLPLIPECRTWISCESNFMLSPMLRLPSERGRLDVHRSRVATGKASSEYTELQSYLAP